MEKLQKWKKDGFKGEQMVVLPTESFSDYVEHPQVKRLYLTTGAVADPGGDVPQREAGYDTGAE